MYDTKKLPLNVYQSVQDSLVEVKEGSSIVFFVLGASGSGKTHLLLNEKNGIIQKLVKENFELYGVFEEYLDEFKINTNGAIEWTGQIIQQFLIHDAKPFLDPNQYKISEDADKVKYNNNFQSYITELERRRKTLGRIKSTPNNPNSSRSHLYIVFRYKTNEIEGFVSFIDMAGAESPVDIHKQIVMLNNDVTSKID